MSFNRSKLKELNNSDLLKRLFKVYKFNEPAPSTVYVYFQNHIEARKNELLGNGDKEIKFGEYQPRVFLNSTKFTCAIEDKDFEVKPDGEIDWKF